MSLMTQKDAEWARDEWLRHFPQDEARVVALSTSVVVVGRSFSFAPHPVLFVLADVGWAKPGDAIWAKALAATREAA